MRFVVVCVPWALISCAAAPPVASQKPSAVEPEAVEAPAATAQAEAPPAAERATEAASETTRDLPTQCAGNTPCVPPAHFAESLCKGSYPSVALAMFEKSSPWQRKWVNVRALEA